jgi:hypothetical protein
MLSYDIEHLDIVRGRLDHHTCCPIIPLDNAVNGSTTSLSPSGLKTLQWCFSIRPFNFGSTSLRCLQASASSVSIVAVGALKDPTSGGTIADAFRFLEGDSDEAS